MAVGAARGRPGMSVVAAEPAEPYLDRPLRLLEHVLAKASDRHHSPVERAVLLARFSPLFNQFLLGDATSGGLQTETLHALQAEHDRLLHNEVVPLLREQGITIVCWDQVNPAERNRLRAIFREIIYPLATPLVVDSAHPFPQLAGIPLNIGVFLRDPHGATERFACVPLPARLFRLGLLNEGFVRIGIGRLIGVELVVCALLDGLFQGVQVLEKSTFRVLRGEPAVRSVSRPILSSTCLEVEGTTSERMLQILMRNLGIGADRVYRSRAPLALAERIASAYEARDGRRDRYGARVATKTAGSAVGRRVHVANPVGRRPDIRRDCGPDLPAAITAPQSGLAAAPRP